MVQYYPAFQSRTEAVLKANGSLLMTNPQELYSLPSRHCTLSRVALLLQMCPR